MASLPPRQPTADPHKISQVENLAQATQKVNRFAKRDPALYPLALIVTCGIGAAGYFFMSKTTSGEPHRNLMAHGVVNPWDDQKKHDTNGSQVAAFKYRHQTREGHMEDSLPVMNEETRTLKTAMTPKFKTG